MDITLDAKRLSRSWLAVYAAAERRPGYAPPAMVRTVHIEVYEDRGVRLMSTDGSLLMTSWVPFQEWEPEPGPEEPVDLIATAHDVDDRLSGLMAYLVQLTSPKNGDDPPEIEVALGLNTKVDDGEHRLDGLEPTYVTLNYPGREIVRVRSMDIVQPDWRAAMHKYEPDAAYEITMNPYDMKRVARVANWVSGPFKIQFQGETGAMRLLWPKSDPLHLVGMVLPIRHWRIIAKEPEPEAAPELLDVADRAVEALRESGLTIVEIGGQRFTVSDDGEMIATPDDETPAVVLTIDPSPVTEPEVQSLAQAIADQLDQATGDKLAETFDKLGIDVRPALGIDVPVVPTMPDLPTGTIVDVNDEPHEVL